MTRQAAEPAFYCDTDGEQFWVKATCSKQEACALVERDVGIVVPLEQVRLVHGFEHSTTLPASTDRDVEELGGAA